jgi:hypothetical protein
MTEQEQQMSETRPTRAAVEAEPKDAATGGSGGPQITTESPDRDRRDMTGT